MSPGLKGKARLGVDSLQAKESSLDREDLPASGVEFVTKFYRLFKGSLIYDRKNVFIDRLNQECLQVINRIVQSEGNLLFKIVRDNFFLNNIKIQVKADKYPIFKAFWHAMKKRWIGELEFTNEVNGEHLNDFVYLLSGLQENNENNYLYVARQLEYLGIGSLIVDRMESFKDEEIYFDSGNMKQYSKEVYFKSIHLAKEVVGTVKSQKSLNLRKAKRLMQGAVISIMQDEASLLGLASIKNYDEYTFNHCANVAIYSIAMGQRIGIPKKQLSHLGMAALFHDIGKTGIPKEILNKPGKLSEEEWTVMRSHPIIGAETVMRLKEWGELSTRMIGAAFEHHLKYDLSGYPKLTRKRKLSLFGRIIALADFYDALVRPRVYNKVPYVSEKIMGLMLDRSGKDFDPALVKVFINMIGIYPLGTLVLLNTNAMGIVVKIQEDTELIDRPKVCLIDHRGREYRKGDVIDLGERDERTKQFRWNIVKTLDPNEYNLNVAEFLI